MMRKMFTVGGRLFTFYTASHLVWNWGCIYETNLLNCPALETLEQESSKREIFSTLKETIIWYLYPLSLL